MMLRVRSTARRLAVLSHRQAKSDHLGVTGIDVTLSAFPHVLRGVAGLDIEVAKRQGGATIETVCVVVLRTPPDIREWRSINLSEVLKI